jgi:hypothetical protein
VAIRKLDRYNFVQRRREQIGIRRGMSGSSDGPPMSSAAAPISNSGEIVMSESAKALLGGFIFLAAFGIFFIWFAAGIPSNAIIWTLRIGLPIAVLAAITLLAREQFRKDRAPDFLRLHFGKPFERDGVCFFIRPIAYCGIAYLDVMFQNQYASACTFRVVIAPPVKSFRVSKRPFDGVGMDIGCDGGAFGIARAAIAIPAAFQGKRIKLEVAAATKYSQGKGQLLRFRNGLRASKADTSGLGGAALTVALLMVGHVHYRKPASITCTLPTGVAETLPPGIQPAISVVWKPGDPTEDFQQRFNNAFAVG